MSAEKTGSEMGKLYADLKDIETDMVRELIRLYEQGTDYALFWERVGGSVGSDETSVMSKDAVSFQNRKSR